MGGFFSTGILTLLRDQIALVGYTIENSRIIFSILDIIFVTVILYYGYLVIRETKAIRILYGLIILGLVYVLAELLNFAALLFLLRSIFAVVLVAIPVVFQPELRAALEKIGRTRWIGPGSVGSITSLENFIGILVTTVTTLGAKKIGALIVIERRDCLKEYILTGVPIDGKLSSDLLLTIFKPGSALHDGAVIIRGNNIAGASALLPVAGDRFDTSIGTRHRAGIGITSDTDAIAIIVSEETGRISLAQDGKLIRSIKREQLQEKLYRIFNSESELTAGKVIKTWKKARKN